MLEAGSTGHHSDAEQGGTSLELISGVCAGAQPWASPSMSLAWERVKDSLAKRICLKDMGL